MTGLVLDLTGFEFVVGDNRLGRRRGLEPVDVTTLTDLTARYVRAVSEHADTAVFLRLGRELYGWLDGGTGNLGMLVDRSDKPLVFEVRAPSSPSEVAWAVLRAPFELLTDATGKFLAGHGLTRFCVVRRLGAPKPGPDLGSYRLGLAFMASAPGGRDNLDYEAEENAILGAVGRDRVDLIVEDSGDLEQLARRIADVGGMPVVHLSCHGRHDWQPPDGGPRVPVLMMEDDQGADRPTTATDLVGRLTLPPRLLFVSACLTATTPDPRDHAPGHGGRDLAPVHTQPHDPAPYLPRGESAEHGGLFVHSLATALVSAGIPAVLGWAGSVQDRAATVFAEHFYRALADKEDLVVATGDARRAQLGSADAQVQGDWHLARLWLGPTGGGRLVGGTRPRSLAPPRRGTRTFLDRKRQRVPVAGAGVFVDRRPELQQCLRALRGNDRAGVLLHGGVGVGKSSLAARITDRLADGWAVAVVSGDYTALAILDAIVTAVEPPPTAKTLLAQALPGIRDHPETLETALVNLLNGPCARPGDRPGPLLLIIDDLDQILDARPDDTHHVQADHAPTLAGVLRARQPVGDALLHQAERPHRMCLRGIRRQRHSARLVEVVVFVTDEQGCLQLLSTTCEQAPSSSYFKFDPTKELGDHLVGVTEGDTMSRP